MLKKLISFIKESYLEMTQRVSWPKFIDLQRSSVLVLIASLIFALLIGGIDFGFENLMRFFYDAFKTS